MLDGDSERITGADHEQQHAEAPPWLAVVRLLGLGAASATMILYGVLVLDNPYRPQGITTGMYIVATMMCLFALLAAWGALTLKPIPLLLAFLGSFVPVGFYLWHTSGIFALIGYANLLYLVVGLILVVYQRGFARS